MSIGPAKYVLFILVLLTFGVVGIAADDNSQEVEIKGAFGYVLGEDGSKLRGSPLSDGRINVQAKSSFRNFSTCQLSLTDEKQIYSIIGRATYDSEKDTDKEFKIILNILEKKYKAKFLDETMKRFPKLRNEEVAYAYHQGSKTILLKKHNKKFIALFYYDETMKNAQKRKQKQAEDRQNNNDPDAL